MVEWNGTVVLTTPRLVLRTFRRDDLPHYAALNAHPEVVRYLGGAITRQHSDEIAEWAQQVYAEEGIGLLAVERREDGVFLGMCGLHHQESYPEDVTEFYGPVFTALDSYLGKIGSGTLRFDFELIYLNSSSAKAVMMLMDKLDAAAKNGASVDVYWYYDKEDDTMQELGEEFGEDLENAKFHLEKMPG